MEENKEKIVSDQKTLKDFIINSCNGDTSKIIGIYIDDTNNSGIKKLEEVYSSLMDDPIGEEDEDKNIMIETLSLEHDVINLFHNEEYFEENEDGTYLYNKERLYSDYSNYLVQFVFIDFDEEKIANIEVRTGELSEEELNNLIQEEYKFIVLLKHPDSPIYFVNNNEDINNIEIPKGNFTGFIVNDLYVAKDLSSMIPLGLFDTEEAAMEYIEKRLDRYSQVFDVINNIIDKEKGRLYYTGSTGKVELLNEDEGILN